MGGKSPTEKSEGRGDVVTTTEKVTVTPTPQQAKTDLREAEKHLSDLEARLTQGDMSVRAKDLSSAQSEVAYLEKVLKGAEATAFREAKIAREERGQQLHQEFVADALRKDLVAVDHDRPAMFFVPENCAVVRLIGAHPPCFVA